MRVNELDNEGEYMETKRRPAAKRINQRIQPIAGNRLSPTTRLGTRHHTLGPQRLGLSEAAGLLVAGSGCLIDSRQRPSVLLLVPPHRQLADGNGAVQEGETLAKAAAHLAIGLGKKEEIIGDIEVEGPVLALHEGDRALEQGHRLGRSVQIVGGLDPADQVIVNPMDFQLLQGEDLIGHPKTKGGELQDGCLHPTKAGNTRSSRQ